MNFSMTDILKLLPLVGPAVAATHEFVERFELLMRSKSAEDQAVLREALADLRADNDEGHRRLQDKLARAAER